VDYLLHLLVFVLLYGTAALGLNVSSGFTQLISLAQATFFGVGAYTTAILATQYGVPLWVNLPLGMILAGLLAFPVALVALRTVEEYFVVCTMGIGMILFSVMNNWVRLTGGPLGISDIPPVLLFGCQLTAKWQWLLLAGLLFALVFWVAQNLKKSALGRVLMAISEDEIVCESFGKNVGLAKLQSFILGAMIAALPGALYAHYVSFIDPTSFTLNESIFILSIIVIGGVGNLWGGLAAAAFMILVPEGLRFLGLSGSIAANARQVLYGGALVLVIWSRLLKVNPRFSYLWERGRSLSE
jgi:branched-chain amino acid transport system permease protein